MHPRDVGMRPHERIDAVMDRHRLDGFSAWPPEAPPGLDPRVRAALDAQGPVPEYRTLPVAELRATFERTAASVPALNEPLGAVEDLVIPGAGGARLYTPRGAGPFPTALFFHGGGWVVGSLATHDQVCRSLASRSGWAVAAVDYPLAPESPFPAALDAAGAALEWAERRGGPVAAVGDSAGGTLAAALALRARGRLALQVLIYPVTDASWDTPSYHEFAQGYGLTRSNMIWFWETYLGASGRADDPSVSPLRAPDLRGLPPCFVATAEFDVLRDEGERYASRLRESGVPARCVRYRGLNHGFIRMGAVYPQADRALTDIADALRSSPALP